MNDRKGGVIDAIKCIMFVHALEPVVFLRGRNYRPMEGGSRWRGSLGIFAVFVGGNANHGPVD